MNTYDEIGRDIIGACMEVHSALGVGLLENTYKRALAHELNLRGHFVETEVPINVKYKDVEIADAFRADIIVDRKIILELKSVCEVNDIHFKQIVTYLKLSNLKLGYLINFNVASMSYKEGFWRIANGLI